MFTKKFKLICSVIGLSVMLMVLPGGAQKLPADIPFSPWTPPFNPGRPEPDTLQQNPLTRENLIQLINRVYAPTLTASEDVIWDTQCAGIYSTPFITFTFIPASPYSRSIERLLAGDFDNVPLFIFYLHEDGASKPVVRRQIEPGAYIAKLVSPTKVIFVDQEGNEVLSGSVEITRAEQPSARYLPCFPGEARIGFTEEGLQYQQPQNAMPDALLNPGYIYGTIEYCYAWCFIRVTVTVVIACTVDEGQSFTGIQDATQSRLYALDRLRS